MGRAISNTEIAYDHENIMPMIGRLLPGLA
jgi:hypothetical protein